MQVEGIMRTTTRNTPVNSRPKTKDSGLLSSLGLLVSVMVSFLGSSAFCLESEAASALMLKQRRGRAAWRVREDLVAAQTALRARRAERMLTTGKTRNCLGVGEEQLRGIRPVKRATSKGRATDQLKMDAESKALSCSRHCGASHPSEEGRCRHRRHQGRR